MNRIQYSPQTAAAAIAVEALSLLFSLTCAGDKLAWEGPEFHVT